MVTVPPVGTAIGAMSRPSTIGLLVVRPSGIKLCPQTSQCHYANHPGHCIVDREDLGRCRGVSQVLG